MANGHDGGGSGKRPKLRSRAWFDNPDNPGMTALYLERMMNYGLTLDELRNSGKPIIGIAQTGSDIAPCNRHHIELAQRVRDGIRDAGGIPIEFPVHPIQETGKRPTAALDRNLAYLSLVEILYGYHLDGVVLTTGCDKTTPAMLMGAATVDIPAIVLSGGPMLNGYYNNGLAGSGTVVWFARQELAAGRINYDQFLEMVASGAPSVGHCNTMGTALSMNSVAEALGMSLPGCAAIPGPYRERAQMAYATGRRIVDMVHEDLRPSQIMTRQAFENAIVAASALGASTNCPPHVNAIARHMGVTLEIGDWDTVGYDIPLLVNLMPAGQYLGEEFHRAILAHPHLIGIVFAGEGGGGEAIANLHALHGIDAHESAGDIGIELGINRRAQAGGHALGHHLDDGADGTAGFANGREHHLPPRAGHGIGAKEGIILQLRPGELPPVNRIGAHLRHEAANHHALAQHFAGDGARGHAHRRLAR